MAQDPRSTAYAWHGERLNRAGEPFVEHLERVAAAVPGEARTVAYLHDMLEHTPASVADLERVEMAPAELRAVQLLTRHPDESFEAHTLRIAHAKGPEGRLARMVKLADIDDHLSRQASIYSDRSYGWARRHVVAWRARLDTARAPSTSAS
jgi:(p)ppGpp synthase/HD superfamily hydrolase